MAKINKHNLTQIRTNCLVEHNPRFTVGKDQQIHYLTEIKTNCLVEHNPRFTVGKDQQTHYLTKIRTNCLVEHHPRIMVNKDITHACFPEIRRKGIAWLRTIPVGKDSTNM